MALTKQPLDISFAKGLDTKTDPFRVAVGNFLALQNTVFDVAGLLQKRNGYTQLASLPDATYTYTTTFSGALTAVGNGFAAYSPASSSWIKKGSFQPVSLDTLALIRSNTNQSTCDAVVSSTGLVCTVYTDQNPANLSTKVYKYAVADSNTGQNLVPPTLLAATGAPKVFLLSGNFVIIYPNGTALLFVALNISTLASASPVTISSTYSANGPFDAYVANNTLYVAWYYSVTPAIKITYIDHTLSVQTPVVVSGSASAISVTADISTLTPTIWLSYFYGGSSTGYAIAFDSQLGAISTIASPVQIISSGSITGITSVATGGVLSFFYQNLHTYTYDVAARSDFISKNTITISGTVGSASTMLRSVGLGSKAFFMNSTIYMMVSFGSQQQPTYFLSDSSGNLCLKLAYQNGGGYYNAHLPNVTIAGSTIYFPYLFKDLVQSVSKDRSAPSYLAIYSQTGINLATVTYSASSLVSAEIASDLHITGGFLWMYDGYTPVEHGFHLYPDDVEVAGSTTVGTMADTLYNYQAVYEWSDNQGNIFRSAPSIPISFTIKDPTAFTADTTSGSTTLTSVSGGTNPQVGQAITGAGIPANTFITALGAGTVTMSNNASATASGVAVTPAKLTALTINVPTLRLTYKTANPVKIVLYRWSTLQQTFYQATSISVPTLNDTSVDSVAITDTLPDSEILGNAILYTTGGVVENIGAPPTSACTLYKERLFLVSSEDKNLLWFSKQVIESVPVEMSDLLTIYVGPTVSSEGSTGPMRALAALDDKLIIFKDNAIYYITGTGPDNTGESNDFSDPIFVTSTVGTNNQNSIAFIPSGLMFQSASKGIWLLGRDLSTQYIGAAVEAFNQYRVLSAVSIPGTNQVRFTLSNGVTLMYDYYYGQWGTFVNIPAVSSTLFQGLHAYIDKYGRAFQESPGKYLDGGKPVLINFTTSWLNLAGLQGYERAYLFYLLGTYYSPHKLTVQVAYDYNPAPTQTSIITPDNFTPAYGGDPLYGNSTPYGGPGSLEQWKIDLATQLCQSVQITVTESFDSFYGTSPGAGLSLSGINMVLGLKRGYRPIRAANTVG